MQGLEDISCFKVTLAENIATVTIDRPPVNAQNRLFRDEIARVFDVLHDTEACRAIILNGAGRAFSAGAVL
jgi:enoyl-CoA hydratase/carnithine racemase